MLYNFNTKESIGEVSDAKSKFISYMSHELRTPLHTILSSTQYLIAYEELSLNQQEKIATVESSAGYLLGMINDILDLAKIEAGKVTISPSIYSSDEVEEIVGDVISMLEVLTSEDVEITLKNSISSSINITFDEKILKQIIINLLSNAIKFTSKGSIEFELKSFEDRFYIVIEDSGIGLSKEELESLFDNFSQIQRSEEMEQKGSGLGLVISRKLARLFDGDIRLSSRGRGRGVRATIELASIVVQN